MKNVLSIQSHVVYGFAGNKSATFPMQLLGVDVWALNTVQFSNHTQYGKWTGMVIPQEQIREIVTGLDNIEKLQECDALLSGYLGSPEQVDQILYALEQIKKHNPNAIYLCDPVMPNPEKICVVANGVREALIEKAIPVADIMTPNLNELRQLSDFPINSFDDVLKAVRALLDKGVKKVLVKHLGKVGKINDPDTFEIIMATAEGIWHLSRPLYPFNFEPVGVGDLIAGTFLANLLNGKSDVEAFEAMNNEVAGVMKTTFELNSYELQTIAARFEILNPTAQYKAEKIA
ncbi:pyridoxal kinase [Rodentibacter pneumotropicus]|uniref:Pyridoxal kinase PdxY n=1 Tax=Rodentibacter pneumotropicus TaxID=758 RepID=A0AAW5LDV9_9PAST|nr:pyridoxal kinase [Rodentibacter pneumotropicus]MCQ9121640.1 pyridoxal kinase [Rodentibacter pneumotropicus]OOF68535.1 pyridoxal kinase [Rodentibacter pneumotropicus]